MEQSKPSRSARERAGLLGAVVLAFLAASIALLPLAGPAIFYLAMTYGRPILYNPDNLDFFVTLAAVVMLAWVAFAGGGFVWLTTRLLGSLLEAAWRRPAAGR